MSKIPDSCDVLVVGGGINGAGIARDLAGRGLSVVLCEKDDLASHTSSSSTKLIHGGLRYLEYYEFSLVRKALQEREVLLRSAPHIMWPLRFVMPHDPSMRPVWMVRAGLFLYDHLARREILPGSEVVSLAAHPAGVPIKPQFSKGFVYSDGWVNDARLVVLNALDAQAHGATVLTHTACTSARLQGNAWLATLQPDMGGPVQLAARAIVNAAGPWASEFLREHLQLKDSQGLRLVKGSHIVVRKLFDHPYAYIFQNPDKRIIFVIPYEDDFTLIGTTDVEIHGDPSSAAIDEAETAYLCEQASRYMAKPVRPADVVWSYSGVRPLLDDASGDPSAVTRDYMIELNDKQSPLAPLVTIWGGKITTFRKLAEEAADMVCSALGAPKASWTAGKFLPGGDMNSIIKMTGQPIHDFDAFTAALAQRYAWLPEKLRARYARAYGARITLVLGEAKAMQDLGAEIAPEFYEAEARYLQTHEWAQTAQDMLWRRSKLGLHMTEQARQQVEAWCNSQDTRKAA